ncbi:MAG: hypothetical protein ISP71_07490 [Flavobacteriales bacterium]|nr:hypothetical protein [Flavobacteriales bacterium]
MKKNLSSKVKILFLMLLYYQILAFYVLSFIILINTNGMISTNIKSNIILLILPTLIPAILSIVGIYKITIYSDEDLLKIKSTNVFLWFSKDKTKTIQIPKLPTISVKDKSSFLGLKKSLLITIKTKNKHRINVSILSKDERRNLIDNINKMKVD